MEMKRLITVALRLALVLGHSSSGKEQVCEVFMHTRRRVHFSTVPQNQTSCYGIVRRNCLAIISNPNSKGWGLGGLIKHLSELR